LATLLSGKGHPEVSKTGDVMTSTAINGYDNIESIFTNSLQAIVGFSVQEFVVQLSDGRRIERSDMNDLAHELHRHGVKAKYVQYEWRAGQRMITAGQQAALCAAIRLHERSCSALAIAA
jgi:hypothetical protein